MRNNKISHIHRMNWNFP